LIICLYLSKVCICRQIQKDVVVDGILEVATGLTEGETEFEETEDLQLMKLPLQDAIQLVVDGEITDAVSVAGLLRLAMSR